MCMHVNTHTDGVNKSNIVIHNIYIFTKFSCLFLHHFNSLCSISLTVMILEKLSPNPPREHRRSTLELMLLLAAAAVR